jgi:Uma2 family endonuclease
VEQRVRFAEHAEPHAFGVTWLGFHTVRAADVEAAARSTVFLSETSEVQPDACLIRLEAGGPRLPPDGYLEGPPQLVLEVAKRAADYDLGAKLELYRRTGVLEYVIWRTLDGAIDWLRLSGDRYERLAPDERGGIQSEVFPGLRLNVSRMLAGDMAGVLKELEQRTEP